MNSTINNLEYWGKFIVKYKSLNKKMDAATQSIIPKNQYQLQLAKTVAVVGLNVVFMKGMFKLFNIKNGDTGDVIAIIETATNAFTVYQILQKLQK